MEVKYRPFQKVAKGKPKPAKPTPLDLRRMRAKAEEAMERIGERNYANPYLGGGVAVYQAALAVGGRTEVLFVFEKVEYEEINF
jgi:hypothetical protein